MSDKHDDGGPAYPEGSYTDGHTTEGPVHPPMHSGKTLLDYFAGEALSEVIRYEIAHFPDDDWVGFEDSNAHPDGEPADDTTHPAYMMAQQAYTIAAAMIAEKRRRESP